MRLAVNACSGRELPEVNQIELHCWLQQRELVEYCKSEVLTALMCTPPNPRQTIVTRV